VIIRKLQKHKDISIFEVVKLMKKLISIPSLYFQEDAIMGFTYNWFNDNGMEAYFHEYHEKIITNFNGKNVICEITSGEDGPTICINSHLDTVKLCNGWSQGPYDCIIKGDKIYGIGALDMKSGCCSTMLAIRKFHQLNKNFRGKIIACFVSDEEGPYGLGTNSIIEDGLLDNIDFSIIAEPSADFNFKPFPNLCLGARGGYGLEVEFFGKSAHAAFPNTGINATVDAGRFMCELENINYIKDEFLGTGVACVVAIESDGGACSVPDYAKVKLFWHIVVGENEKTIEKHIEDTIKRANIKSTFKISFREASSEGSRGFMPFTVPQEDDYVKAFSESIKDICGYEAPISYLQSIGDFNYLGSRLNAPTVIFGAEGENFHGANEYATISSIVKTAEIIYNFLVRILTK